MDADSWLEAPVSAVDGVGPRIATTLESVFGIRTVRDLLEHYPAQEPGKYRDMGAVRPLAEARVGEAITVVGRIEGWSLARPRGRKLTIAKATVRDDTGVAVTVPFFNQDWRARQHPTGTRVAVSGTLERFKTTLQLKAPKLVVLDEHASVEERGPRIEATYPATEALPSHRIARFVAAALDVLPTLPEHLPERLRDERDLMDLDVALRAIHRPEELREVRPARTRLVYDELLCLQIGLQQRRERLERDAIGLEQVPPDDGLAAGFLAALPFDATADQLRALGEIRADLARPKPMHRLLQGDVGTGKTLVATWAMLCAADAGRQAVLMAPTEILAEQHYRSLSSLLAPLGVNAPGGPRLELITGGMTKTRLRTVLADLVAGQVDLVIGTHAVLEERVMFADLGVVVVDEQHRFGVEHRARLRDKRDDDRTPDVLVMTATPIPRSLALTVYGDLDVTTMRERPNDLAADMVSTVVLPADSPRRAGLYDYIRERVAAGERAYVVCPLIEESDALRVTLPGGGDRSVASAVTVHAHLASQVFGDLSVGLVHGRVPSAQRDEVMEAFRRGDVQVLVATTVIEVGVDVGDATVMVIEDADRFGISQLHQLRGRLYRGLRDNYCVLFSSDPDENPRLGALATSDDGFELAEVDLRLRGEGSLFDTRQSGLPDLKLAKLVQDYDWVVAAREDAKRLVADDPELAAHPRLAAEVRRRYGEERLAALETG